MFKDSKAFSSFSIDDVKRAQEFYGVTLDMKVEEQKMGEYTLLNLQLTNGQHVLMYPKNDHQPATFTVLNFPVKDIEATVDEMTRRGVQFEHYEGMIQTDLKGISFDGKHKIAWFKDPAGNILSVIEEK